MTESESVMTTGGIVCLALGLALVFANKPMVRALLEVQWKDPDAPKNQWNYPIARGVGWFFVVLGLLAPTLALLGVLK